MTEAKSEREAGRERTRTYRERMRAKGLRPYQVWLPDRESPAFREELRREAQLVARSEGERRYVAGLAADVDDVDWPYEE